MSQHPEASHQSSLLERSDCRSGTVTRSSHISDVGSSLPTGKDCKDGDNEWIYHKLSFERSDVQAQKPKASEISRLMEGSKSQPDQQQEKADIKKDLTPKRVSGSVYNRGYAPGSKNT
jgi:hypothetical protein